MAVLTKESGAAKTKRQKKAFRKSQRAIMKLPIAQ